VAANPHPFDGIAEELAERAMMIAYSHGKSVAASALEFLKIERSMFRISLPEFIALFRSHQHVLRKRVMQLPEAARAF
jgi:hypothetical protein